MEEGEAPTAADHAGAGVDISAQQEPPSPPNEAGGHESEGDDADEDFEFAFAVKFDDPDTWTGTTADEIFSDGFIRPIYPVFGRFLLAPAPAEKKSAVEARPTLRSLFVKERSEDSTWSSSSPEAAKRELEGVSPATYCLWSPRTSLPPSCKKSRSTRSSFFLRWRLRDLVVGKEKFVFLPAARATKDTKDKHDAKDATAAATAATKQEQREGERDGEWAAADAVGGHGFYYGRGRRRSVLPYKEELVGFLANVNALSSTHQAF